MSEGLQTLNCPKCGAKLPQTDAGSVTCEYCGTVTVLRHTPESPTPTSKAEPTAEAAQKIAEYVKQIEQERAQPRVLQPRIEVIYQNGPRYGAGSWLLFLLIRLIGILIPLVVLFFVFGPQNSFRFVQTAFQFIQSRGTTAPVIVPPALSTLIPAFVLTLTPEATAQGKEGGVPVVVAATAAATNTPRANAPVATATLPANNCPNEHARIVSPRSGATLRGTAAFTGNADIANLAYYKLESRPENTTDWKSIFQRPSPVSGDLLQWDTTTTAPGRYQVRLVVVDKTGNFPDPCVINVTLVR